MSDIEHNKKKPYIFEPAKYKKKLIVSGCSWGDKNFFSQFHPDMDCDFPKWPELLAEKLKMESVNLCKSGAGQEYIYASLCDTIQRTPKHEIGLVLAAWSTAPRRCYKYQTRWSNDRTDQRGDLNYWIERSIRYQYAFQNLMEQEDIPYRQWQMISLYKGHLWELKKQMFAGVEQGEKLVGKLYDKLKDLALNTLQQSPYDKKFKDTHLNWPTDEAIGGSSFEFNLMKEEHRISELDRHPNAKGHELIANYLFEKLEGVL